MRGTEHIAAPSGVDVDATDAADESRWPFAIVHPEPSPSAPPGGTRVVGQSADVCYPGAMGELIGELVIAILDVLRPTTREGKVLWVFFLIAGIAAVIAIGVWL